MTLKYKITVNHLRILLEEGFTISKTEFIAYLHCSFKFYILKELNNDAKSGATWITDLTDHRPDIQEGLKWHQWFNDFYNKYGEDIRNGVYPIINGKDEILKKKFIDLEIKRYNNSPQFWEPIGTEFMLNDNYLKGKIDRIDKVNEQGHCRIIEYKKNPGFFDKEELLFYTLLLSNTLPHPGLPGIIQVTQIGTYYYNIGEFNIDSISLNERQKFEQFLHNIRKEMLQPNLAKNQNCNFKRTNCLYHEICRRIRIEKTDILSDF